MSLLRRSPAERYGPSLLDRLPVGVSVYRLDDARDPASLRVVYSNEASARITGLDVAPEIGRRLVDIVPAAAGTPVLDVYASVARGGPPVVLGDIEYGDDRIARRTYHVEAVPLPDRSVGVVFEDVTDRNENAALREARGQVAREEVRYRTLVEATAAVVWTADAAGAMAPDDAASWCAFTGQTPGEAAGLGWLDAVDESDRARARAGWAEAVAAGAPFTADLCLRRADGETRRMHARAVPVVAPGPGTPGGPGPGGAVAEYVGVFADVEDQNAAAVALAASEARFRTLFDALADPVFVYALGPDGPGPFLTFNQAALDLYGYPARLFAAMTVHDLVVPGSVSVPDALDELRRTRQATFESAHRTRDGRVVPMQTSARLVEYEGRLCVLAVARDDTARRAFQSELSRANLGLERTVAARTAELQAFAEALTILHRITTADHPTPEARTDAYLRAGCAMFDLPVGILSATPVDEATGERLYRIEAVVSPDPSLTPGLTVPISEAFCDAVLERGETVAYADAADVEALACHPAYASRGLRAFIGTPIRVDGEIVGTLNFVSPAPRPAGFRPSERDLIELMADAVARRIVADRAEQQRRQTEDYYRAVVETVDEPIVTLDAAGAVARSNPAARRALGLDAPGGRWPIVGEDGRPADRDGLPGHEVLRTGRAVRGRLLGVAEPGRPVRWFRVNAAPVDHEGDGRPEAVVVSYTDVTDLREAERTLAAHDRLRVDTARIARVGGWAWDVATDRVEWSPELFGLLGVDERTFAPSFEGYLGLVAEADREHVAATVGAALAPGSSGRFVMEHGLVTADRAHRLLCHGEVERGPDGAPARVVGSAQALSAVPGDGAAGPPPA